MQKLDCIIVPMTNDGFADASPVDKEDVFARLGFPTAAP